MRSNLPAPSQPWGMDIERRLVSLEKELAQVKTTNASLHQMMNTVNTINGNTGYLNVQTFDRYERGVPANWNDSSKREVAIEETLTWPTRGTRGLVLVWSRFVAPSLLGKPPYTSVNASQSPIFNTAVECNGLLRLSDQTWNPARMLESTFDLQTMAMFNVHDTQSTVTIKLLVESYGQYDYAGILDVKNPNAWGALSGAFITF